MRSNYRLRSGRFDLPQPARVVVWLMAILMMVSANQISQAQKPGTVPSKQAFNDDEGRLPIQSFLFLSESGSQVVMPDTTWEQLERLKRLDAGNEASSDRYVFQSLDIDGDVVDQRAEMDVSLVVTIEPTDGRYAKIALGMSNFHRLEPAKITGIDDQYMTIANDGSGYQWWVRSDTSRKLSLKMKVSSRVETTPASSMTFRLPSVPSTVHLSVDAKDVLGEIVSGAEEVISSSPIDDKSTEINVEGNGGNFTLRWGPRRDEVNRSPLLEVESRVDVRWDSPQDQPMASVRLTAQNIKGSIAGFRLLLPTGSVVVGSPRLGTGGRLIEFVPVKKVELPPGDSTENPGPETGELVDVVIPKEEQQSRIDLNFELQLSVGEVTSEAPLKMTIPRVVDSLWHRGDLSIRVSGEYRLRWEATPWIRGEAVDSTDDNATERMYRFRFDRGTFEIPLWLSTKERRLRLSTRSELTIRDTTALLRMQINVNGTIADNQLRFDDASWDVLSIINQESGERLETFLSGKDRVIELRRINGEENVALLLVAERTISQDLGDLEFPLPRIIAAEDDVTLQESTLDLLGTGRTILTVDLAGSKGLYRIITGEATSAFGATISRFRLSNSGEDIIVAGMLQEQPLRVSVEASATIEVDGTQILSTIDWTVTSPLDLEGRLPIRIPRIVESVENRLGLLSSLSFNPDNAVGPTTVQPTANGKAADVMEGLFEGNDQPASGNKVSVDGPWIVTVGDVPATLRQLDNDRYELISERLASGTMDIRWRHSQDVSIKSGGVSSTQEVALPRPRIPDVTIRGAVAVTLRGDGRVDLVATNSPETRSSDESLANADSGLLETGLRTNVLTLDTLPREPLSLRLRSQQSSLQDLTIEQLVIRSAIGHQTRHEQVLARVRRGSEFRVRVTGLIQRKVPGPNADAVEPSSSQPDTAPENPLESQRYLAGSQELSVEALVDGTTVPVENQQGWLVVILPGDQQPHTVELRVWVPEDSLVRTSGIRPIMELPSRSGRVFWQVITPSDSHIIWASPTVGRAMSWRFDQWKLFRQPSLSDRDLVKMVGGSVGAMPPGNRYLFVGTDIPAFEVLVTSRTVLWLVVGSTVLLLAIGLTYFPILRHPMTAIFGAVAFTGLLIIAPDAAVLAGQSGMIASVLVIVMFAVRTLLKTGRNDRIFASNQRASIRDPSARAASTKPPSRAGGISETAAAQVIDPPSPSPSGTGAELTP